LKIKEFVFVKNPVENVDNSLISTGCIRIIFANKGNITGENNIKCGHMIPSQRKKNQIMPKIFV